MEQKKIPKKIPKSFLIKFKYIWQNGFVGLCNWIYLFILVYSEGALRIEKLQGAMLGVGRSSYFEMFPCSHETTFIYVCMEVFVFMSYLKVLEHFQTHNLKWPILRKIHLYNNLLLWHHYGRRSCMGKLMLGCCLMASTMHSHYFLEFTRHDLIGLLPHWYVQGH
jgi:hypothetical protein